MRAADGEVGNLFLEWCGDGAEESDALDEIESHGAGSKKVCEATEAIPAEEHARVFFGDLAGGDRSFAFEAIHLFGERLGLDLGDALALKKRFLCGSELAGGGGFSRRLRVRYAHGAVDRRRAGAVARESCSSEGGVDLEVRPLGNLAVGELDGADAEREDFAAIEREVGGAGEFEAAAEFGELVAREVDVDELADGDFPEVGDFGVEIGARIRDVQVGPGAVGEEEILLGFHVGRVIG